MRDCRNCKYFLAKRVTMNQYKIFRSILVSECTKKQIQLPPFEHEKNAKYCDFFEKRGGEADAEH